ncbi:MULTISPECIES: VOC family protein [unclassified Enterococcus]|uniref:VOC family protein n=1 Tax=unclassified Enterococcus TaxID=2608891 RepID=UPI00155542A0|nr:MULTISPECIES: VOC family protein [unclassified Enterococcus]MBS7576475.1 VOC family protein [Enterococcus sp. MMGLQ5-2]MBS7583707.1 VOC family protein [Enterococcus sp. MMGLQ5-1]NPD11568.1 VOC family protein [Enterococcus sp. MMGLQ5-1]NPD36312.1 VOC family protein [Enterococcus sp. MMGLQ5-2]
MFSNHLSIMLYVKNVAESIEFWRELGFYIQSETEIDGTLTAEIKPSERAELTLVLYDLEFIMANSPEVAGNTPSILFQTSDITTLYQKVAALGFPVGEVIHLPDGGCVFNFSDPDGNYFAVAESEPAIG